MSQHRQPLCQLINRNQVEAVVDHFYQIVLKDAQLAPYFDSIADWSAHQDFIVDFWWGLMGGEVTKPRPGAMIRSHESLGIDNAAMQRWLMLFAQSIDELLPQDEAQQWQRIAQGIATMMGEHGLVTKQE